MKAKFTTFGGGLLTGLLLVLLLSSTTREKTDLENKTEPRSPELTVAASGFHLVPIDTFYKNVARYRSMHVKAVRPLMPGATQTDGRPAMGPDGLQKKKEPSRMFIYTIDWLEKFIVMVRSEAITGGIDPEWMAIRFYYAVYPEGKKIGGHDYGKLHTLYMIPNYWNADQGRYMDLDLIGAVNEIQKAEEQDKELSGKERQDIIKKYFLENIPKAARGKIRVFMLDASTVAWKGREPSPVGSLFLPEPPVINQGQLCPPNCPTTSLLDVIDAEYGEPVSDR
jgi:hypothetical protein